MRLLFCKPLKRTRKFLRVILCVIGLLLLSIVLLNFNLPVPSETALNDPIDSSLIRHKINDESTWRRSYYRFLAPYSRASPFLNHLASVTLHHTDNTQPPPDDSNAYLFLGLSAEERSRLTSAKASGSLFTCSLSGVCIWLNTNKSYHDVCSRDCSDHSDLSTGVY